MMEQTRFDAVTIPTALGSLGLTYGLTYNAKRQNPTSITIDQERVVANFGSVATIVDHITERGGLIVVERTWKLKSAGSYRLQTTLEYLDQHGPSRLFIPALWYEDNIKGTGVFPSLKIASTWSFLETRMAVPCCGQLSDGSVLFSCATEAATEATFLASLTADRNRFIISIPGSEWPYRYLGKRSLEPTALDERTAIAVPPSGLTYRRPFYFSLQHERDSLAGYCAFIAQLPPQRRIEAPKPLTWNLWSEYKMVRLINLVRPSSDALAYLIMGEGNGEVQPVYEFTAASFLVKSLQGAYILASITAYEPQTQSLKQARSRLAARFGLTDDRLLLANVAKLIGDFFLNAEREPGFFLDNHDLQSGAWGGYLGIGEHPEFRYMANSRCNGEAMKHYVLLYQRLLEHGIVTDTYLALCKRVARFYIEAQLSGGSFGRWWTAKRKPGDIQGTNGAYIGSFFTVLLPLLDESDPLKDEVRSALHKAYTHYGRLADEGSFYGDTLDADSCDKEAGVALLSFFLDLYEREGESRHLTSAKSAARFIVQWIWQQDSYLDPESPLGAAHFRTKGMTSVSVAHHHLDFYGMAIAYEFFRYHRYSGDDFFLSQGRAMIEACRQLVATEQGGMGRDDSFVGWQAEQLNHTDWEYFNRPHLMGGHYDIDIAWVTVLTLGSYLLIEDEFPSVLEEG